MLIEPNPDAAERPGEPAEEPVETEQNHRDRTTPEETDVDGAEPDETDWDSRYEPL